ncbi:MAG: PCP reductase family protein [Gemmatimonadota bacterium]
MKFLCVDCDSVMDFAERQLPGDGTMAAVFRCGRCEREVAMLTNPMETRLVSGLGVKVGGKAIPDQPMELVRSSMADGREDAFVDRDGPAGGSDPAGAEPTRRPGPVTWSPQARERLENVPSFVRGMVKRIYTEWAWEQGVAEMTPEIMDRARTELGLEGM